MMMSLSVTFVDKNRIDAVDCVSFVVNCIFVSISLKEVIEV
jgi:hypothetical protein